MTAATISTTIAASATRTRVERGNGIRRRLLTGARGVGSSCELARVRLGRGGPRGALLRYDTDTRPPWAACCGPPCEAADGTARCARDQSGCAEHEQPQTDHRERRQREPGDKREHVGVAPKHQTHKQEA